MRRPFWGITFDFWNTIAAEVTPSILETRAALIASHCPSTAGPILIDDARRTLHSAWQEHRRQWVLGEHMTTEAVIDAVPTGLAIEAAHRHVLQECVEYLPAADDLEVAEDLGLALAGLRSRGVRIGLICDTGFSRGRWIRERLDQLGLADYFTAMTFSDEVRSVKPKPAVFQHAANAIGPVEGLAHVGDLHRTDIAGANRSGWKSIWYRGMADDGLREPVPWATIHSHVELLDLADGRTTS